LIQRVGIRINENEILDVGFPSYSSLFPVFGGTPLAPYYKNNTLKPNLTTPASIYMGDAEVRHGSWCIVIITWSLALMIA